MNTNVPDLTTILLNVLNEHSMFSNIHNEGETEGDAATRTTPTSMETVDQDSSRLYYFIVFNNPKWSKVIQKRRSQKEQQQEIQPTTTDSFSATTVNVKEQDKSVDDQFIAELRRLINRYVQQTKHSFPLRYFIDLTDP